MQRDRVYIASVLFRIPGNCDELENGHVLRLPGNVFDGGPLADMGGGGIGRSHERLRRNGRRDWNRAVREALGPDGCDFYLDRRV
ncbi:hypothetical protein SDC9_198073 [bioreactor metagenome]|uniref:Uncharacterized protein n=1 Tax=bioreactor metagenome TaxID=1076179 RepID=A0A645IHH1_9ZZZZ